MLAGIEFSERLCYFGLATNMIIYLTKILHEEVKTAAGVPITGVISDGQHSIRNAVKKVLKDVPHLQFNVFDVETLRDAPYEMTAAGVGDMLAALVSLPDLNRVEKALDAAAF